MRQSEVTGALQWFYLMRQGSAILIGILLAQFGLPADEIGVYEILLYIGVLTSSFWVTGLAQALLSLYHTLDEAQQRRLTGSAFLVFTGLSVLLTGVLWMGQNIAIPALASRPTLDYFGLFLLWQCFNLPSFLIENLYLLYQKASAIFWFGIFSFGLQMAAVLTPVLLGIDFVWSFYGLIAVGTFKFIWLVVLVLRHSQLTFDTKLLRQWSWIALPLAAYALLASVNNSFSFWLVGFFYRDDEATFAIFRYGAREFPLVIALANALGTAIIPALVRDQQAGLEELRDKSRKLFHLLFPLSIALMLSSKTFFPMVFSEAFAASAIVFNTFLLITISRLLFARPVLMALQANRMALVFSIIEFLCHIIFSTTFAWYFGLPGIAMGVVLACSVEKVLLCFYLWRRFGVPLGAYTDLRWWVGYSVALTAAFLIAGF